MESQTQGTNEKEIYVYVRGIQNVNFASIPNDGSSRDQTDVNLSPTRKWHFPSFHKSVRLSWVIHRDQKMNKNGKRARRRSPRISQTAPELAAFYSILFALSVVDFHQAVKFRIVQLYVVHSFPGTGWQTVTGRICTNDRMRDSWQWWKSSAAKQATHKW